MPNLSDVADILDLSLRNIYDNASLTSKCLYFSRGEDDEYAILRRAEYAREDA